MFYLIDKPAGISSFDVIRKLRKILSIKKMGHVGTLDPFATGCLLIATGKSTKLIPLLESSKKEYIATIRFDGKTDSYDTETPVEKVSTDSFSWKSNSEIEAFLLSQKKQTPPKYSAIHIHGKRSYELARKGKDFVLEERNIEVFSVEVIYKKGYELQVRMLVSSGCYMRSFGPILGSFFGSEGGYLIALERTKIDGKYMTCEIENACQIDKINYISISNLFHTIHTYEISDEAMKNIIDGRKGLDNLIPTGLNNQEIFFLSNKNISYISLCKNENGSLLILKNDVD